MSMSKADEAHQNGGPLFPPGDKMSGPSTIPVPAPALPEYVERTAPPPTYEEIMGHQTQTSVQQESASDIPPLAYIDIMPRMLHPGNLKNKVAPQFDKFSYVTEVANEWLRSNPGFAVWKCETVERKVESGPDGQTIIDLDKMVIHHSTYGFNVFVRGIRMWLVKKVGSSPPQQLGLLNVVPEKKVLEMSRIRSRGIFIDPYYQTIHTHQYVTYDGFMETIAKLNSRLKVNPIPGTILNVESATIKTFELGSDVEVDPDLTCYTSEHKLKRLTKILRIFYLQGPPQREEICVQEFLPVMTRPSQGMAPPQYESWPMLNGQLGSWLASTRGIRVVNIQVNNAKLNLMFGGSGKIDTDCTDEVQTSCFTRDYIKVLRVFYTTGSQLQSQPVINFSSRLFLPVRIGRRTFESMAQTMFRIDAWLRLAAVPIYNVETVQYKLEDTKITGAELDKCTWNENPNIGNYFVTAVRVYFPCTYVEPDPSRLPPVQYYDPSFSPGEGGCCSIS